MQTSTPTPRPEPKERSGPSTVELPTGNRSGSGYCSAFNSSFYDRQAEQAARDGDALGVLFWKEAKSEAQVEWNEFCETLNSGGSYCDYWKGEIERDFEREASRAAANQSVTNLLDAQDWRDYRIEQWTLNCQ